MGTLYYILEDTICDQDVGTSRDRYSIPQLYPITEALRGKRGNRLEIYLLHIAWWMFYVMLQVGIKSQGRPTRPYHCKKLGHLVKPCFFAQSSFPLLSHFDHGTRDASRKMLVTVSHLRKVFLSFLLPE